MPTTLHTRDLILRLKHIRDEQELSCQRVYDMIEANGDHVSLNSIRKVFADGSEDEHFRYQDTIQPIARALMDVYGDETGDSEIDGLKAAIHVKDELIAKLQRELADRDIDARRKIDYLKEQIVKKDERIDRLMSRVDTLISEFHALLAKLP